MEKKQALISVIVPVYNVADYLDQCVQSIVTQSYQNIEVILVDDGSTDGAGARCDAWAAKDSRIKVLHQSNAGLSVARNNGVAASSGEVISFVDPDDWIDPDFYLCLYQKMTESGAEIATATVDYVYQNDKRTLWAADKTEYTPQEAIRALIDGTSFGNGACNKLYRREKAVAFPFPPGRLHEDNFVVYKMLASCSKLAYCTQVKYYYRQRKHGIMGSGLSGRLEDRYDALFQNLAFVQQAFPQFTTQMKYLICSDTVADYPTVLLEAAANEKELRAKLRSYRKSVSFSREELKTLCMYRRTVVLLSSVWFDGCALLRFVLREWTKKRPVLFE